MAIGTTPNDAPGAVGPKNDSLERALLKLWQAEVAFIKAYDRSEGNMQDARVARVAHDIDTAREMAARLREGRTSRNLPIK